MTKSRKRHSPFTTATLCVRTLALPQVERSTFARPDNIATSFEPYRAERVRAIPREAVMEYQAICDGRGREWRVGHIDRVNTRAKTAVIVLCRPDGWRSSVKVGRSADQAVRQLLAWDREMSRGE